MILLISDTPVAGTVPRLANWLQRLSGSDALALVRRNYDHNAFDLPSGTFGNIPNWQDFVYSYVSKADVIFVHNIYDKQLVKFIFNSRRSTAKIFFQLHSPPFEGPAYVYSPLREFEFDKVFAVAQGHGRFIKGSIPVPNVIRDFRSHPHESRDLVFLPHLRSTSHRWSSKFTDSDLTHINTYKEWIKPYTFFTIPSFFGRNVVTHGELVSALSYFDIIVDDINSGMFHQTALEGLKAGRCVFSAADAVSIRQFCSAADCPPPPFMHVKNIDDVVRTLVSMPRLGMMADQQEKSKNFADQFLGEERLARRYLEVVSRFF